MVIGGPPPDRLGRLSRATETVVRVDGREVFSGLATTVVVATGQFLRGNDLVPRGHPGDGRAEVQVYSVPAGERTAMKARLATGTHVPHPGITQASGRTVEIVRLGSDRTEIDGHRVVRRLAEATIEVIPAAYRLLV
jgi:diacylglycerol kinase family enzyme